MSSTLRGYDRHVSDYYVTPVNRIEDFLREFMKYEPSAFNGNILDCCAGGDEKNPMSYPTAIKNVFNKGVDTVDIREDSRAKIIADFLEVQSFVSQPSTIITNPPFNISRNIINKALEVVENDGFVIMLLRLNYFGGKVRRDLWESHMPQYCFVHNRRMSFTDNGKTDSIEYAHFVWRKNYYPKFTRLVVID